MTRKMIDGNGAATEALKLARVKVISAYPITPQSPISEKLSDYCADGSLKAQYIRVESEHSAMSCAIGAQLTGVRAATATSSVGLALMHEVLGVASGCRIPLVMPVVNRSLVSPWSLWADHQDSMAERDSGWLQFYAENAQEVLDLTLMAYKIAEHDDVLLPVMPCMDGFFLSHSSQPVEVPDQATVDEFLPEYKNKNLFLDPLNPMFINDLTPSDDFTEMRYQQEIAFINSLTVIQQVQKEFADLFGRSYGLVEDYRCDDAEVVLVTLGSMSGTAKYVVNKMREEGKKVGVLKITVFRPFPVKQINEVLKGKKIVGVIDRSAGLGANGGPVWQEVNSAIAEQGSTTVYNYIAGLGGRDITTMTIENIFTQLLKLEKGERENYPLKTWIDNKENALDIRVVK